MHVEKYISEYGKGLSYKVGSFNGIQFASSSSILSSSLNDIASSTNASTPRKLLKGISPIYDDCCGG